MKKVKITLILIFLNFVANAAVIYTDITDVTYSISGNQYNLDLDQNSVIDFKIDLNYPVTQDHNQVTLIHQGTNRAGVESTLSWLGKLAWNLNLNDSIDQNLSTWMTSGLGTPNEIFLAYYAGVSNAGGTFLNQEGYLPLEFKIGTNTHYGWVRISVNSTCNEFTVKDFAYEDTPATSITAGNTGVVGIAEVERSKLSIYPNPTTGVLNIDLKYPNEINQIEIYSIQGQLLTSINKYVKILNLKNYNSGLYIVAIHFKDGTIETNKVTIE